MSFSRFAQRGDWCENLSGLIDCSSSGEIWPWGKLWRSLNAIGVLQYNFEEGSGEHKTLLVSFSWIWLEWDGWKASFLTSNDEEGALLISLPNVSEWI